jgi:hypothetical protein
MFGKTAYVSPLESRKQLLIAESELNRAQLSEEWQVIAHGVGDLAHRAKTMAAWASSAALLVAGLAAFRRTRVVAAQGKPSWWQTLLKGAQLAASLWLEFHRRSG